MSADVVDYKIYGDDMQIVEIELDPGEGIRAEAGTMMYMEQGIEMQTKMDGGLFGGFKRALTGESFFITTFLYNGGGKGHVSFGAPYPGKVIPLNLGNLKQPVLCQKDSFLCAAKGIDIDIALTKKLGAGFFGGEGFILQKLTGDGLAFVHAGGTVIRKELKAGESLKVDTGCIVAFTESTDYDIQFIGGFTNALFGGEGLFLCKLTGPGVVLLQSLPFSRLANRVMSATARSVGESKGIAGMTGMGGSSGGLIGNMLFGDG